MYYGVITRWRLKNVTTYTKMEDDEHKDPRPLHKTISIATAEATFSFYDCRNIMALPKTMQAL